MGKGAWLCSTSGGFHHFALRLYRKVAKLCLSKLFQGLQTQIMDKINFGFDQVGLS